MLKQIIWLLKNSGFFIFIKSEVLNYFLSYPKLYWILTQKYMNELHLILTQKYMNELICFPSTHCSHWIRPKILFAKTCMLKLSFLVSHMKNKTVVGIQNSISAWLAHSQHFQIASYNIRSISTQRILKIQISRLRAYIEFDLNHQLISFFHFDHFRESYLSENCFKYPLLITSPSSECITEEVFYLFPFRYLIYIETDVQESLLGSLWESLVHKWNK